MKSNKNISNGLKKTIQIIIKILLLAIILIFIQILLTYFFSTKNTDQTINTLKQNNIPVVQITTNDQKEMIMEYLRNNISKLSPEKEVLGGKFYITNTAFVDNNNLIVDYEDGHIALKARIKFEIDDLNNIKILNFEIIKIN